MTCLCWQAFSKQNNIRPVVFAFARMCVFECLCFYSKKCAKNIAVYNDDVNADMVSAWFLNRNTNTRFRTQRPISEDESVILH